VETADADEDKKNAAFDALQELVSLSWIYIAQFCDGKLLDRPRNQGWRFYQGNSK